MNHVEGVRDISRESVDCRLISETALSLLWSVVDRLDAYCPCERKEFRGCENHAVWSLRGKAVIYESIFRQNEDTTLLGHYFYHGITSLSVDVSSKIDSLLSQAKDNKDMIRHARCQSRSIILNDTDSNDIEQKSQYCNIQTNLNSAQVRHPEIDSSS
jgi:hypothetical protein